MLTVAEQLAEQAVQRWQQVDDMRRRGVRDRETLVWLEFGWDCAQALEGHYARVLPQVFPALTRRPAGPGLDWFRWGFALQRQGRPRPCARG